jgi:hypothetical protein
VISAPSLLARQSAIFLLPALPSLTGRQMIKPRKEELDRLTDEQARDQKALDALKARMAKRNEKIDPLQEERTAEENRFVGIIARLLVAEDSSLKRRFVQQSAKTYGGIGDGRARRYLERVIGKIPVNDTVAANTPVEHDPVLDAAAE